MRRVLVLALAVLTLVPAAAAALVGRAQTVLPPGESGFVSDAGTGAGSPHRYDQVSLFVNFQWKPALFGQPGTTQKPRPGVKIVRDRYGVPAVTAGNDEDAWFGVGYAAAQDRLTELELFRRRAFGRLAEALGEDSLVTDIEARRDLPGPAALDVEVAKLPARLRARLRAYRDGVNKWIAHVRKNPADKPAEFDLLGVPLRDWTVRDSAGVGALLVRTVPWASEGREIQNAHALRGIGKRNFDRLVPLHVKGAPLIIPRSEGSFPSQPGRTRADEKAAFERSRRFLAGLKLPPSDPLTGPAARPRVDVHGGSYVIAVRRGTGGVLYSGPQLGFAFPETLYEVEVHRPGLNVRGGTAPGAPVIAVGFNRNVAWGITSGESDTDDVYAEKLAGGAESYRFNGKVRKMSCRNEVFRFSSGSTTKTRTERLCRTVHGPVQQRAGGWAYARRFATFGRELETIVGLDKLDRAGSVGAVDRALRDVTWNENVTAVDDDGHLGFWHPGLLPLRPHGFDERLPYPGTGEAEWRGFLPVSKRPHVIDPEQNWLSNWNNIPAAGWTSGDGAARGRLGGRLHRATFLYGLVRKLAAGPVSLAGLKRLLHRSGTIAQQRPLVDGKLKAALAGSTGRARAVLKVIVGWDGSYARTNGAGTVAPGVAAWQEFKQQIQNVALGPMGPGALQVDGENAAYHFFDSTNGPSFGLRTLGAPGYRKAAVATFAVLAQRFGTPDTAKWREPRHDFPWIVQGAGSPPPLPFFERGTFEQLVDVR
ncbi:MAG TPA: penicillin acylase family protein [Thermoleophilaceae bacterium]|nr:penicillin acylase family protein [Thermoleophilaceae bacterium]